MAAGPSSFGPFKLTPAVLWAAESALDPAPGPELPGVERTIA